MPARILIAEDDKDVLGFLARLVESLGYEAITACDGYSAMAAFRERRPDLVLLDYAMPAGSGGDVYRQLRGLDTGKDLSVIFVSATPKYQLEQMVPPDPRIRFVDKPVDAALLGGYIRELLGPKA
ncbi:MAG: response regulator [Elusimicrobia bacterium]|nr:response regulator [Elusimicrobiota bacterium]